MAFIEKSFEAIYENGVLRPMEGLRLPDGQHVMVSVSSLGTPDEEILGYFSPEDWAAAKDDAISLSDVRQALSGIRGSLAEAVIASRDGR